VKASFWDNNKERCTKRLYPAFSTKFVAQMVLDINSREEAAEAAGLRIEGVKLRLSAKRVEIGECANQQIFNKDLINTVDFKIKDDIYTLRNKRVKEHLWKMIQEEKFKVKLGKISVPMFDRNQTTPKPPPPTIPPIGEVGVDWTPIIIAIIVIFVFFVVLAILTCFYHSYLLKQGKFTEKNSDQPQVEEEEDEDEDAEDEEAKKEVMATVMDDVIIAGEKPANKSIKVSEWRLRYTKQVHPINDTSPSDSTKYSTTSDHYRASAQLDRLALDDSSDDENNGGDNGSTFNRAELFAASSTQSVKKESEEEDPMTQVQT